MIEKFKLGYYYRYTKNYPCDGWVDSMNKMINGGWFKCIKIREGKNDAANFLGIDEKKDGDCWYWDELDCFEEKKRINESRRYIKGLEMIRKFISFLIVVFCFIYYIIRKLFKEML